MVDQSWAQLLPLHLGAVLGRRILKRNFLGAHQGGHGTTRFLQGFLEGSLKEVLLRRVLRLRRVHGRHLVRGLVGTEVFRRVLGRGGIIELA